MASIYRRGNRLYARLKNEEGWFGEPTPYCVGDEAKAKRFASQAQASIDAKLRGGAVLGTELVDAYAEVWLELRRQKHEATRKRYEATGAGKVQHRDHATDAGRMCKHVLPHLGAMKMADVRARHLAAWIHLLRTTTTLAPHTIRNIYGLVSAMFRDATVAGLVDATPCILTANELGEEDETDGAGRYAREQLELMIGSAQLPEHARVFAALGGLGGLRLGAIAGLRWGDLDTAAAPLWRLTSSRTYANRPTKTGKSSVVPVHPVLAAMLTTWRHGWGRMFGRAPAADDPIVPRSPGRWIDAPGTAHSKKTGGDLMDEILATLDIPAAPMKSHALRSTFISISLEDGADDRLIERITHTAGKTRRAFDRYDRADYWPQLCAEVAKLRISPKSGGRVVGLATSLATGSIKPSDSMKLEVEAPGVEGRIVGDLGRVGSPTSRNGEGDADARGRSHADAVASLLQAIAAAAAAGDVGRILELVDELRAATGQGGGLRLVRT